MGKKWLNGSMVPVGNGNGYAYRYKDGTATASTKKDQYTGYSVVSFSGGGSGMDYKSSLDFGGFKPKETS